MSATYDDNNIFAKILRGEIPSTRVYETDDVVAFMDVMPQGTGHTLVVPKTASAICSMPSRKPSRMLLKWCRKSRRQ